jgi:hypothetical protein
MAQYDFYTEEPVARIILVNDVKATVCTESSACHFEVMTRVRIEASFFLGG